MALPDICRTEHYAMSTFTQDLPNGKYTVRLHFAETNDIPHAHKRGRITCQKTCGIFGPLGRRSRSPQIKCRKSAVHPRDPF